VLPVMKILAMLRSQASFHRTVLRTALGLTCSNQSTGLPSSFSWIAMWVIAVVGVACFRWPTTLLRWKH
jgi:hypothetical protein